MTAAACPSMTSQAIGFYLCDRPRGPEDEDTIAVLPEHE